MKWCDGYVAFLNGAKIGRLFPGPFNRAAADPVDLTSPWILHRLEGIGVHPPPQSRQTNTPDVATTQRREVDVEQRVLGKRAERQNMLEQIPERLDLVPQHAHICSEISSRKRDRHRRNAERE